jgi:hypothetical protein
MGMHKSGGTKARGRTQRGASDRVEPSPTRPNHPVELRTEASRPVGPGGTKHRGDRRDTNRQFTGNIRTQPNFGDPLGSGKKQTQGGGRGLKQPGRKRK